MKHFVELQQAVARKNKIDEYVKRIDSLGYMENFNARETIGITQGENRRYTFKGIADIIGDDRMDALIKQFAGLVAVELHKVQQKAEATLEQYTITHADDGQPLCYSAQDDFLRLRNMTERPV